MGCINAVSEQSACNSQQHGSDPIFSSADEWSFINATENSNPSLGPGPWQSSMSCKADSNINDIEGQSNIDSRITNGTGSIHAPYPTVSQLGSSNQSHISNCTPQFSADQGHCRIFPDLNDSQSLTQYSGLTNSGMNATLANINDPDSAFPDTHSNVVADTGLTENRGKIVAYMGITENRGSVGGNIANITRNRGFKEADSRYITKNCDDKLADIGTTKNQEADTGITENCGNIVGNAGRKENRGNGRSNTGKSENRNDKVADTGTTENRSSKGANTVITENCGNIVGNADRKENRGNERGNTGKSKNRDDRDADTRATFRPLYELIEEVSDYLKSLAGDDTLAKLLGESIPKYVQYLQPDSRMLLLNRLEYAEILSDIKSSVEEKYRSIAETIIDREKRIEHLDAVFEISRIVINRIKKLLEAPGLSQGFAGFV